MESEDQRKLQRLLSTIAQQDKLAFQIFETHNRIFNHIQAIQDFSLIIIEYKHNIIIFIINIINNLKTVNLTAMISTKNQQISKKAFDGHKTEGNSNNYDKQNDDLLFSEYIWSESNFPNSSHGIKPMKMECTPIVEQQSDTMILGSELNFDTFNRDDHQILNINSKILGQKIMQSSVPCSYQKDITEKVQNSQKKNILKKGNLKVVMRRPLGNQQKINNNSNILKQPSQKQTKTNINTTKFQQITNKQNNQNFPSIQQTQSQNAINKSTIEHNHKCSLNGSVLSSVACNCQQFDKLLQITSRCVDYYSTFKTQKDTELKIVRQAFVQIQMNLLTAFNSIIDEIKAKHQEILSFLTKKQKQLYFIKEKQQVDLKRSLEDIRGIHLSNLLFRQSKEPGSSQIDMSIFDFSQNTSTDKVKCCGSVSDQINNYAKTLHGFYQAMEEIQKNSFKENVDETINFINNLITEEIKYIVYEKLPQKSINCSFSFNNNSLDDGQQIQKSKLSSLRPDLFKNGSTSNNLSLNSPSIVTNIDFSEPASPKGSLRRQIKKRKSSQYSSHQNQTTQIATQTQQILPILQTQSYIRNSQKQRQQSLSSYLSKIDFLKPHKKVILTNKNEIFSVKTPSLRRNTTLS